MRIRTVLAMIAMAAMIAVGACAENANGEPNSPNEQSEAPQYSTVLCGHPYRITSDFGAKGLRPKSSKHRGVDIDECMSNKENMTHCGGTFPVCAAADGDVITAKRTGGYGLTVVIKHGDHISTLYAHGSKILVKEGQRVRKGEQIMLAGSTGISTGVHLHFGVLKDGAAAEPASQAGIFAAGSDGAPLKISNIHAYPSPWKENDNAPLRFAADEVCGQGEIEVKIKIYDVRGALVRNLSNTVPAPTAPGCGSYKKENNAVTLAEMAFSDVADDKGSKLASGVYTYELSAEEKLDKALVGVRFKGRFTIVH